MAISEELNARFREALGGLVGVSERNMMGGTCFMVMGHMVGGAWIEPSGAEVFMFRVGVENDAAALAIGHGEVMEMGGRRMRGLYRIAAEDCPARVFDRWRSLAVGHALSLPPK
ncbi:hypothetical protein [Poseidonocella sedimentorum]|uniref:TfoX N-terminal domain-containing protein n=1 Tax=Poseidonocella sedimentorum TaxID=871652 RepID=A0A1I6D2L6_9RHOB|nr:hypothetical protein [Poseidonocella sedimentorum]SFQ99724.1 TfoX N-terminal domain-containing protein [Poseidonocella sedimentorum]